MVRLSKISLGIGFLGVLASGALNGYLMYKTLGMVSVSVPNQNLPAFHQITAGDLTKKFISKKDLSKEAMSGNVIGKITSMEIPKGSQIRSFELANGDSMSQIIHNLYTSNPTLAFTMIHIPDVGLNQTIQPNQTVNFLSNDTVYSNVKVLSVSNSNKNILNQINSGISNAFSLSVAPKSQTNSSNGSLYLLIGAPWSTIQALSDTKNEIYVIMGNAGQGYGNYALGSAPVNVQQQQQANTNNGTKKP